LRFLIPFAFLTIGELAACTHGPPANEPITDIRAIAGSDSLRGMLVLLDGKRVTGETRLNLLRGEVGPIEVIKPPESEDIFGPDGRNGIMRITTKSHIAPPSAAGCTPHAEPYFEYQVSRPAIYIENEINFPQPTSSATSGAHSTGFLVQVVVDTLGMPDAGSFKILRIPNESAARATRYAMIGWRFLPAVFQGCRVPQLVQTEVSIPR
jgi:hypothetical protein